MSQQPTPEQMQQLQEIQQRLQGQVRISPEVLRSAKTLHCENPQCGNHTFTEVSLLKLIPKTAIGDLRVTHDVVQPFPVFACNACGHVNASFVPPFFRPPQVEDVVSSGVSSEPPSKPLIVQE